MSSFLGARYYVRCNSTFDAERAAPGAWLKNQCHEDNLLMNLKTRSYCKKVVAPVLKLWHWCQYYGQVSYFNHSFNAHTIILLSKLLYQFLVDGTGSKIVAPVAS